MKKSNNRIRRHSRVRAKIKGTKDIPRVSVFRSNRYLFVQLIDDAAGKTIVAGSDRNAKLKGSKSEVATKLAKLVADSATKAGISKVVFDRGGYKYHGRVKALAEALRAEGLKF